MNEEIVHRELARRLAVRSIEDYRQRFLLEEDLLSGVDRQKILDEIDDIKENVKLDDRRKLLAERDMYKKLVEELEKKLTLYHLADDRDCDEEFEI